MEVIICGVIAVMSHTDIFVVLRLKRLDLNCKYFISFEVIKSSPNKSVVTSFRKLYQMFSIVFEPLLQVHLSKRKWRFAI